MLNPCKNGFPVKCFDQTLIMQQSSPDHTVESVQPRILETDSKNDHVMCAVVEILLYNS